MHAYNEHLCLYVCGVIFSMRVQNYLVTMALKENGSQLEDLLLNEIIIFIDKMDLLIESRPG